MTNTITSLIEERRCCVNEQRFERDPIARQLLQFRIDEIDRELHKLQTPTAPVATDKAWRPGDQS